MTFLKSIETFMMNVLTSFQEARALQAKLLTRNSRLETYISSKGCNDVACVEHWIKEFDKQERRNYVNL